MRSGDGFNAAAQLERTVLAWDRSALAVAATGGLLVRESAVRDLIPLAVVGLVVVASGVLAWCLSIGRYAVAGDRRAHRIADRRRIVLASVLFIVVLSTIDLVLVST